MSNKLRVAALLSSVLILLLSCGIFEVGLEQNELSANTGDPVPGLSSKEPSSECELSDFEVYLNQDAGYCFGYPQLFNLVDSKSNSAEIRGPGIGSEIEPVYAAFIVEIDSADEGISLRDQAKMFLLEFSVADPETFSWAEFEIDDEPGILVEPVPVQLSWKIIFVQHAGKLYRLMYWPVDVKDAQADLDSLFQVTAQTFRFID